MFRLGNKEQSDELGAVDMLTAQNIKEFNEDFKIDGWDSDEEKEVGDKKKEEDKDKDKE